MAWPLTPLRTYNFQAAPEIKADDLNKFQSAINGVINGTYKLKGLNLSTANAGTTPATAATGAIWMHPANQAEFGISTSVPTAQTGTSQLIYSSKIIAAWANFSDNNGTITLNEGFRITSIVRQVQAVTNYQGYVVTVNTFQNGDPLWYHAYQPYGMLTASNNNGVTTWGRVHCSNYFFDATTHQYFFWIQKQISSDSSAYLNPTDKLSVFFY